MSTNASSCRAASSANLLMTAFAEDNAIDRRPLGDFAHPRPLRRRRFARHTRRAHFPQRLDRRVGSVGRRACSRAGATSRSMGCRSHRAQAGRSFRAAEGRALRSHPDEPALRRRRGGRGLSARIRRGAAHGACGRSGRSRHRSTDPERRAGPSERTAGSSARSAVARSARPRLSRPAVRLARYGGKRGRSVPSAGKRFPPSKGRSRRKR